VAKKTGKKPSASAKSKKSTKPVRANHKKMPAVAAKAAGKVPAKAVKTPAKAVKAPAKAPVKTPAKAVVKPAKKVATRIVAHPAVKSAAKPVPAVRVAVKAKAQPLPKGKPDRAGAKGTNGAPRSVPAPAVGAPSRFVAPINGTQARKIPGFTSREVEHFRDLLLAKRRELIGDMSAMEREALRTSGASNLSNLPIHMADMGTDNYEQEFTLGLVQKDRDLLKEINLALAKMQNGSYGQCEGTGQLINKERLEYQPWARYSVEHQRKMERHGR